MAEESQDRAESDDNYISRIRSKYSTFSNSQKKIAEYLASHSGEISSHSITSLAKRIGTTPSSLTRFCQMIQYQGFTDLKFCVEKRMSSPFSHEREINLSDRVDAIKKKLLAMEIKAVTDTLTLIQNKHINQAVNMIRNADAMIIYADGGNSATASYAYHAFLQLGLPCNAFSDYSLAKIAVTKLKKNDVIMGITFSGNSTTVLEVMEGALRQGAHGIGVTAFPNSSLAKMASVALCYSLNIGDDLRYLHIARMCEISVIGLLQSALINAVPGHFLASLECSKKAIESFRRR